MIERVEKAQWIRREAMVAHSDRVREIRRSHAFVRGDQWEGFERSHAFRQNRPMVNQPICQPIISLMLGQFQQNPTEVVVKPRDGGDQRKAHGRTDQLRYVFDMNDMEWLQSLVYHNGIVCGFGYFSIDMDYSRDGVNGRMVITDENPEHIILDPNGHYYDGSDDNYRIRDRWMVRDHISHLFGKSKADQIMSSGMVDYAADYMPHNVTGQMELFRVSECWHKEYKTMKTVVDQKTGQSWVADSDDNIEIVGQAGEKMKVPAEDFVAAFQMAERPRFKIKRRPTAKMYVTTVCGDVELAHGESPFNDSPYCRDKFPIIAYRPLFLNGSQSSAMDVLIDIQRRANVAASQVLHIINQSANPGWAYTTGALEDPGLLEDFGGDSGLTIPLSPGAQFGRDLVRIQPAEIPRLDHVVNGREEAKAALNIDDSMMAGGAKKDESGRAIALKQQQTLVGQLPYINPMMKTLRQVSNFALNALTTKMPMEQTMRIVDMGEYMNGQEKILMQQNEQYKRAVYQDVFGSFDSLKYDCVTQETQKAETRRAANWDMLQEFMQMFPGYVTPEAAMDAMDLPMKEKIIAAAQKKMQQEAGGMPPGPQQGEVQQQPVPGQNNPAAAGMEQIMPPAELGVKPADVQTKLDGAFG